MKRDKPCDPRKITEKIFQEEVRKAALIHGWRFYHPWLSVHSTGGYPDCTMVHANKKRIIFAELKAEGKYLTRDQKQWLDDLKSVGVEAYVWHPSEIDEIWEILRR